MRKLTDFCGIKVNIDHLASGLYSMMLKHPDSACLSLGMFPASTMEAFDIALKKKVPDLYHLGDVKGIDGKDIRSEITHAVCSKILELATADGICQV